MDCPSVVNLSSAYLDQELSLKERQAVEAHLKECSACRWVYEDLQDIVSGLKSLPLKEPNARLWPTLKGRVREEAAARSGRVPARPGWKGWLAVGPSPKRLVFAAAAAFLFMIALALSWTWRTWVKERTPEDIALAEIQQAERHYEKAIESLNQIVAARKSSWDPQFTQVFEVNLQKIDQAIVECKEAVQKYPKDPEAAKFLLEAYNQKAEFLQEILEIKS